MCKYMIGIDPEDAFVVVKRILGKHGNNMRDCSSLRDDGASFHTIPTTGESFLDSIDAQATSSSMVRKHGDAGPTEKAIIDDNRSFRR